MIAAALPLSALLLLLVQTAVVSPQPLGTQATVVDSASSLKDRYDYVVVGGGTSGLVVANRLTEDPSGMPVDRLCNSQYQAKAELSLQSPCSSSNTALCEGFQHYPGDILTALTESKETSSNPVFLCLGFHRRRSIRATIKAYHNPDLTIGPNLSIQLLLSVVQRSSMACSSIEGRLPTMTLG